MDICRAIAQNLAGWMAETNTLGTLEDVSRASGVSFGTVQRIRRAETNPTVRNLEAKIDAEQAYLRECAGHR